MIYFLAGLLMCLSGVTYDFWYRLRACRRLLEASAVTCANLTRRREEDAADLRELAWWRCQVAARFVPGHLPKPGQGTFGMRFTRKDSLS